MNGVLRPGAPSLPLDIAWTVASMLVTLGRAVSPYGWVKGLSDPQRQAAWESAMPM
jgi:hypothetical protein